MSSLIANYLNTMSYNFFIRQVLVILGLFLLGFSVVWAQKKERMDIFSVLLAYPVGLSVYAVTGLMLLIMNIPFNIYVITPLMLFIVVIGIWYKLKQVQYDVKNCFSDFFGKNVIIIIITLLCITVISCSGLFSVSVSNDSLYYYSMYPKAMASYGVLRRQFNVFLTDVGQSSALVGTLPFMYGFNESFGIQMFLNIDCLLMVAYSLYETCIRYTDRKKSIIIATFATLLLLSQQPYIVMNKWAMANGYFMNYMFICALTAYRCISETVNNTDGNQKIRGQLVITGILFTMFSQLRMEGCIITLILIICISILEYSNKQLFFGFLLPMAVLSVMYDIKIFLVMRIDAPYTFLTQKKALIQFAAIFVVAVYILVFRGRFLVGVQKKLPCVVYIMLIAVNGVLFVSDKTLYITNLKTFINNISNQSGWGIYPMLIIGMYIISILRKNSNDSINGYWDMIFITYVLATLAVSFAREDALVENLADSGNRVLLQVTVTGFYAAFIHVINTLFSSVESSAGNI